MKTFIKYLSVAMLIPASLWAGNLAGTVTTGGAAVAGALVVIRQGSTTAAIYDSVYTGATGAYQFSELPAATYYVTTTDAGFVSITNTAQNVTATGTTTYNPALAASVGVITGVARGGGMPFAGLVVTLTRGSASGTVVATTTTDSTGTYRFANVPSGAYYVTISNPAASQTVTDGSLTVTNGGTVTANFLLSTTALEQVSPQHGLSWVRSGDRLNLDVGVSSSVRWVFVRSLNGAVQYRVPVAAGESRASIPATYANGFLFQVR